MRKLILPVRKTKIQISCAVTAQLISAFVFATHKVQSLFFLNLEFQACSILLLLHRPVCVRTGRKPQKPVFLCHGSDILYLSDIGLGVEQCHLRMLELPCSLWLSWIYFVLKNVSSNGIMATS